MIANVISNFTLVVNVILLLWSIGAVALYSGFPNGNGRIWLDNLYCRGTENRLIDCRRQAGVGTHNCVHSEDVGVRCPTCTQGAVRLQSRTRTFGRLEICNQNVWGTVCEFGFGVVDAQVVCRQLGFSIDGKLFISPPVI